MAFFGEKVAEIFAKNPYFILPCYRAIEGVICYLLRILNGVPFWLKMPKKASEKKCHFGKYPTVYSWMFCIKI